MKPTARPWILLGTVTMAAFALAAGYIRYVHFNVIWADAWGYLALIGNYLSGRFNAIDIFAIHNRETRPIVLRLLLLLSARFDHLNLTHLAFASLACILATTALIVGQAKRRFAGYEWHLAAAAACIVLAECSLSQWWSFILPINVVFFSMVTFSVAAIILIDHHTSNPRSPGLTWSLVGGIACSELALASIDGGVVVWAVVGIQIASSRAIRKAFGLDLAVYLAVGIVSIFGYTHGFAASGLSLLHTNPLQVIPFFIVSNGNSLVGLIHNAPSLLVDATVGSLVVGFIVFASWQYTQLPTGEQILVRPWIFFILLGVGESLLIALGRSNLGAIGAASSSYTTLTLMSVTGAMLILAYRARSDHRSAFAAAAFGLLIVACVVTSNRFELGTAAARREYYQTVAAVERQPQFSAEQLRIVRADTKAQVLQGKEVLQQFGLSLYQGSGGTSGGERPLAPSRESISTPGPLPRRPPEPSPTLTPGLVFPIGTRAFASFDLGVQHGIYAGRETKDCCFLARRATLTLIKPIGAKAALMAFWVPGVFAHGVTIDVKAGAISSTYVLDPAGSTIEMTLEKSAWPLTSVPIAISSRDVYVPHDTGMSTDMRTLSVILRGVTYR